MTASQRSSLSEMARNIKCPWFWRYQKQAEQFYTLTVVEVGVAGIISGNFLVNIVQSQIDPQETKYVEVWSGFEMFFNVIFTLELMINMYAFWFDRFWDKNNRGWNIFDIIVVFIGLMDTVKIQGLPPELKLLRMMRAFRVFRLFKRIKSLNQIVSSLLRAIPGVVNAFIINTLVMCIYAVLGVTFFKGIGAGCMECENDADCSEKNTETERFLCLEDVCTLAASGRTNITNQGNAVTGRNLCFGEEYFGTFFSSLYTLFQVLSGDSWSEAVVRPILEYYTSFMQRAGTAFYFVTYILLNAVVLINVVVAVLLEKMAPVEAEEAPPADRNSQSSELNAADPKSDGQYVPNCSDVPPQPEATTTAPSTGDGNLGDTSVNAAKIALLTVQVAAMREQLSVLTSCLNAVREDATPC